VIGTCVAATLVEATEDVVKDNCVGALAPMSVEPEQALIKAPAAAAVIAPRADEIRRVSVLEWNCMLDCLQSESSPLAGTIDSVLQWTRI
jgi:hypothetical protein